MAVRRITPYLQASDFDAVRDFYGGLLGLEEGGFGGEHVGFRSSAAPDAQVVAGRVGAEDPAPQLGVDVGTPDAVDAAHAEARRRGFEVLYGPVEEPWGIRRFFVRDPTGVVVSVLAHRPAGEPPPG